MASKKRVPGVERFDDVTFNFLPNEDEDVWIGSVVVRADEMVLDLPGSSSVYPYVIQGKQTGHYFAGENTNRDEDCVPVIARWSHLGGDLYVGMWVEEGEEFLFSFRLPPSGGRKKT